MRARTVIRCRSRCDNGERQCSARYLADGELIDSCGDPCSFVMQKGGAGDPPFNWRQRLYVGDKPLPGRDWSGEL
jgi:hypothetical protein